MNKKQRREWEDREYSRQRFACIIIAGSFPREDLIRLLIRFRREDCDSGRGRERVIKQKHRHRLISQFIWDALVIPM